MGLLDRLQRGLTSLGAHHQLDLFGAEAPATIWQHPSANRAVTLGQREVRYLLRRARRRTIGFLVSPEGLIVSASRWVGQGDIDRALQAKGDWIVRKLQEQGERVQRQSEARVIWRDGECLPYLGRTLRMRLDAASVGVRLEPLADDPHAQWTLFLDLPSQASDQQWRERVQGWLQHQAMELFQARCAHFAPRLGVTVKSLKLSTARTRWGSARVDGSIRLNWRLIHFGLPVIDYVVVHELAHLREMNHSAAFWDVVRSAVPDFEQARQPLHQEVLPVLEGPDDPLRRG